MSEPTGLCPICSNWAREFATLDDHHPNCPNAPKGQTSRSGKLLVLPDDGWVYHPCVCGHSRSVHEGYGWPSEPNGPSRCLDCGDCQAFSPMKGKTMRKREELTNPASCLNRAREDEMIFVLLGRDAAATVAVQAWISERLRLGKNQPNDAQIVEAHQWIATVQAEQQKARRNAS